MLQPKQASMDLTEHLIPHSIAPENEICFTKKCSCGTTLTDSTGHPRAACLKEWWQGLLKISLQHSRMAKAWRPVAESPKGYGYSTSASYVWYSLSYSQEWKWKCTTRHNPWWPMSNSLASCSQYYMLIPNGSSCQGHKKYPIELKVDFRLPLVTLGSGYPRVNQWREELHCYQEWLVQATTGKVDCFSPKECLECNRFLQVWPCPVIKIHGKLQQPNPGRMINVLDPSGMSVWVTKVENQDLLRCWQGWKKYKLGSRGCYKHQLKLDDQLQEGIFVITIFCVCAFAHIH